MPYFKISAPLFCCHLLFKEYLNPQVRIKKIVNKHSTDQHPSSFRINFKDTTTYFHGYPFGVYLSLELLLDFQTHLVRLTGKCILKSKNIESRYFYTCPRAKLSPRFLSRLSGRGKLLIPHRQHFFSKIYPSSKKRGDCEERLPITNQVLANYPKINKKNVETNNLDDICSDSKLHWVLCNVNTITKKQCLHSYSKFRKFETK